MSSRSGTATAVGILFVTQMATAVAGSTLIQRFVDGDRDRVPLTVGVALMGCSGVAVVVIGLLMYPVLEAVDPRRAVWYPVLRIVECTVSIACGVYLLARSEVVPNHLLWVYVPTAAGGLILTWLLLAGRLVPRPIALLGLIGYACLALGIPLDLAGALDMSSGGGQVLLVPGGLFEAVVLPIWLITKGFRPPPEVETDAPAEHAARLVVDAAGPTKTADAVGVVPERADAVESFDEACGGGSDDAVRRRPVAWDL